jgi:beta-glucosidase
MLSYPSDEVGNSLISLDDVEEKGVDPYKDVLSTKQYRELFGYKKHIFTCVDYVEYYEELVRGCGAECEIIFANHAKAILHAWYPGALGGLAVAEILAGEAKPCAKLPVTIYSADSEFPDFKDYDMRGRTYRYFEGTPIYPFGYGLSYTKFAFSDAKLVAESDEKLTVSVDVENIGAIKGKEKVQVYAQFTDSRTYTPKYQLCAIKPVELEAGEKKTATLEIDRYWVKAVLEDGSRVDPDGSVALFVGGSQPDALSLSLTGSNCEKIEIK